MNRGATIIGVGAMIFTATTVLVTARDALNRIADAKPAGKTTGNFWTMLLSRLVSTAMLGTISIILLVSLVMETLASALTSYVAAGWPPAGQSTWREAAGPRVAAAGSASCGR